jgi:BirA family biotin operon repressor/biotin-[acetyl-CoA-carboxylase] ligase
MRLDPAAIAAGLRLTTHDGIDSTNARALELARRGEAGPLWITAQSQTAGRGRHRRKWASLPGNLYATLLLRDPASPARAPELAFVAGLAVHDAVAEAAPALRAKLTLKWPNDLLCDEAKLAGILIEGEGGPALAVAIGIGINCRHHPPDTNYPATDLAAAGAAVAAEDVFSILSRAMVHRLAQWRRGAGFAAIRSEWVQRAGQIGRGIRVAIGTRELEGRFDGLDAAGRLLLRCADGRIETVSAGDVFPLAPETA